MTDISKLALHHHNQFKQVKTTSKTSICLISFHFQGNMLLTANFQHRYELSFFKLYKKKLTKMSKINFSFKILLAMTISLLLFDIADII